MGDGKSRALGVSVSSEKNSKTTPCKGSRPAILTAILLIAAGGLSPALAAQCHDDPAVVGKCVRVHGRIRLDADLRIHLWPIGTSRLLEVAYPPNTRHSEADVPFMPENLRTLIGPDRAIFGDLEICRLAPDRPGRMGFACVQSAARLVVQPGE